MLEPIQNKPFKIYLSKSNPLFFTSDLHFFHKRIVEFTNRPTTIEEHNNWVINQINNVVPITSDTVEAQVYHLGDFLFSCTNEEAVAVVEQLNGTWNFILGNHDCSEKLQTVVNTVNKNKGTKHRILGWYYRLLVVEPQLDVSIKAVKKQVILCHFPIEEWDSMDRFSYHLFGHMHGGTSSHSGHPLSIIKNRLDVGLDNNKNHRPFSWEELRDVFRKQKGV